MENKIKKNLRFRENNSDVLFIETQNSIISFSVFMEIASLVVIK